MAINSVLYSVYNYDLALLSLSINLVSDLSSGEWKSNCVIAFSRPRRHFQSSTQPIFHDKFGPTGLSWSPESRVEALSFMCRDRIVNIMPRVG